MDGLGAPGGPPAPPLPQISRHKHIHINAFLSVPVINKQTTHHPLTSVILPISNDSGQG